MGVLGATILIVFTISRIENYNYFEGVIFIV